MATTSRSSRGRRLLRGIGNIIKMVLVPIVVVLLVIQTIRVGHYKKEAERKAQNVEAFQTANLFEQQRADQLVAEAESKNTALLEEINQQYADIDDLNGQIDALNQTIDQKEEALENLRNQVAQANAKVAEQEISAVQDSCYEAMKFRFDGNFYYDVNEVQFYTDPTCTIKIEGTVRFMSNVQDTVQADNGLNAKCMRTDAGTIVYFTGNVNMVTEYEYIRDHG